MSMEKGRNDNHPLKGSALKVEPIREKKDIESIKRLLSDHPRDLALFLTGINTNLRASDLVKITVREVSHIKPGESLEIKEKKTGKLRRITLNKKVVKAIQDWIKAGKLTEDDFLFKSRKGGMLTVQTVNALVKSWCRAINLKGDNYGSHTLRKTWGYHQRVSFGVGLPQLMVCFNHSSQKQTLDYLCVQDAEIKDVYMNEI